VSTTLDATIQLEGLAPSTEQLLEELARTLDAKRIVELERVPCAYGSSWWLEEITLQLDDNSRVSRVASGSATGTAKTLGRRL
jgi:hypothetical protein